MPYILVQGNMETCFFYRFLYLYAIWNLTKALYCVLAVRKHALSYFQKVPHDT